MSAEPRQPLANLTIMLCVNGAGRRMPPMFVVKGKTPISGLFQPCSVRPGTKVLPVPT